MAPRQYRLDEGQGGWFREPRPHREAAFKGRARPTHAPRVTSSPPPSSKGGPDYEEGLADAKKRIALGVPPQEYLDIGLRRIEQGERLNDPATVTFGQGIVDECKRQGATSPPDQTGKRFLVFCDGMGSRSFDTPEEAKAFAKGRYAIRRYDDVEVLDQETERDIARFG